MNTYCIFSSKSSLVIALLTLLVVARGAAAAQDASAASSGTSAPRSLITQPVDETQLTVLKGNTHHVARPQFDQGVAPASLPMQRMLLVLKRSPEQESALRALLDNQQDKRSPSYHKWLTPEQYGQQFGPTNSDIQNITSWLQSHGFEVGSTKGRTVLEFSGNAGQVQEAFHTTIHKYAVNGEEHWANASDPQIPTALTPAVAGILSLHNFLKKPQIHVSKQKIEGQIRPGKSPLLTFSDGTHGLAPADYATIYNFNSLYDYSVNAGTGAIIGVVGRSNLYIDPQYNIIGQDVVNFRDIFIPCCAVGNFQVILNGPDPGDLGGSEEAEATLDTSWAGGVATGATIDLVVSATTNTTDGVDLSELYIVESNLADVMTESFGTCEYFASDAEVAFHTSVAEQAAAQGITYLVSTGDNGAEGCDDPSSATATGPISVNLLASTPFNIAVGGTEFNENGHDSLYWSPTNNQINLGSALSYIPEDVWNESCSYSTCGASANLSAGSGGASSGNVGSGGTFTGFTKPSWQSGVTGIPADGARNLPDVSLTAAGHDPYLLCLEGSCITNEQGQFYVYFVWGTSASSPSFAGVMAFVDVQMASLNPGQGRAIRQGQANYVLYPLAATENAGFAQCNGSSSTLPLSICIFNDTTVGNNSDPGEPGYPNGLYSAGVGYDQATGLGSVDVANLVANWNNVTFNPTTASLVLNNGSPVNITHGQSVSVNISVVPNSGSGTPTGDVSLLTNTNWGLGSYTLSGGAVVNASTSQLLGGNYQVLARYAGDATFAPSDSAMVPVTVSQENSTTTETILAFNQNGQQIPLTSVPFGSFVYLRADVQGLSGQGVPTGSVTFADTFGTIPGGSTFALNSEGNTANPNGVAFDAGTHTLSASYSGDASFNASSTSQSQSVVITPGFTASVPAAGSVVAISAPGSSGNTSVVIATSTGFSGTISLSCSGLPSEATCTFTPSSITATGTPNQTTVSILVTTTAPVAQLRLRPQPYFLAYWMAGAGLLFSVILIGAPKPRLNLGLFLLLLVCSLIIAVSGCGSGGGGNHGPPPNPGTPTGTYSVVVNATSGSTTNSSGFVLVVE